MFSGSHSRKNAIHLAKGHACYRKNEVNLTRYKNNLQHFCSEKKKKIYENLQSNCFQSSTMNYIRKNGLQHLHAHRNSEILKFL